jgi:uncharacterized protein involved in oxidation of intracellular sulfur
MAPSEPTACGWRRLDKIGTTMIILMLGDAVVAAKKDQRTPEGFYNTEKMIRRVLAGSGTVLLCGTCMDARGIAGTEIIEGTQRSDMAALAEATVAADKVLTF